MSIRTYLVAICVAAAGAGVSACTANMQGGMQKGAGGGANPVDYAASVPQPLLRLSAQQYMASAQDIFNVTLPALDLPTDDAAGPFAANYASSVTDLSVEQYQAAANTIASLVGQGVVAIEPCAAQPMTTDCAHQLVTDLGRRALRRPLDANEVSQFESLVAAPAASGDNNQTVQLLVQSLLQSPSFLYRPEFGIPVAAGQPVALSSYEAATRLSYVLWGTTPDATLLDAAQANQLLSDAQFAEQADRLLSDPRFGVQMGRFVQQLLNLQALGNTVKDPNIYPAYTPELTAAMRDETSDFVSYVMMHGDGRWDTLLTAPYSVVKSSALASLYGVTQGGNDTTVLSPKQRAGLLTQAAFLTVHAHSNVQPAVVLRGKIVRENLLCQTMPSPPANVPSLPGTLPPDATARQIFAAHEANPACASCHKLMDPIGLSFETYDGIGAYRSQSGNSIIDPSGSITGTANTNVSFADTIALTQVLATSSDVQRCIVNQAMRFAMSREMASGDGNDLLLLGSQFANNQHSMRELMRDIVMSPSFRRLAAN